jgi:hypothetical protein
MKIGVELGGDSVTNGRILVLSVLCKISANRQESWEKRKLMSG